MPMQHARQRLCGNCLSAVTGLYCAHCGQKQKSAVRHVGQLTGEFCNDVLNLDAKLLRTLKPLLFKPGFLSLEYFAERRARYVSPLKLYFLLSLVAFFLIQRSVDEATGDEAPIRVEGRADESNITIGNFNGRPWHAKTNPVRLSWLPDAGNDLINERLSRLEDTVKRRDWTQLLHAGLAATPQALLVLLPFFALLLKLAYWFKRRLFMEHLIVALHNHAFLMLAITALTVLSAMASWTTGLTGWTAAIGLLSAGITLWIPLYFLLVLKRVYRQDWPATCWKFGVIGFSYLLLAAFGVALNLVIGLLML
jgi:hypothetical protein